MMSSTYCDAPCIEQHASIKQMCFIQQKGNNAGSIRSGTDQAHALNGFQPFPGLLEKPVFMFVNSRLTRSEEHTSELQSLMRISYAVFCLKKKKKNYKNKLTN